jgi:RimJ/RimL family protein N-acetyltransferase
VLTGEHVTLRALERGDLPQLLEWRNSPELRRFFRQRHELTMDDQLAWYERVSSHQSGPRDTAMLAIERRGTQELVGTCGLCYIDWVSRTAELSIYVGAGLAYVDGVLAPDACRVLKGHAFDDLGIRRLWTEVYSFDTAKAQLLGELGFTLEGTLRRHRYQDGAYHDSLLFGLLCSDST